MKVEICLGQNCSGYGGDALAKEMKEKGITFTISECRSLCPHAPVVFVDGKAVLKAKLDDVMGCK